MAVSLRRANPGAPSKVPAAFHVPLFHDLVESLDETQRHVVLDLGTASTGMLKLLGRCRCRVEIVDLAYFGGIDQLSALETRAELDKAADALVPDPWPGEPFDLVFCWDLPNYLTLDALSALMKAIARRARPGALAHALIVYAERQMGVQPGRYVPTAEAELVDSSPRQELIDAPRYSPADLGENVGGFTLDRARLLGNGMQEFLFRL
jgi:hypothetical protein